MAEGTDQELNDNVTAEDAEISRIKEEIGGTRSQMSETIDELQERLSVPALSAQIKEEVSEQISSVVETTKDIVYDTAIKRVNKIMNKLSGLGSAAGGVLPLLLIGAGAGLIVMNRTRSAPLHTKDIRNTPRGEHGRSGNGSTDTSTLEGIKDVAANAYHRVGDAVSTTASKLSDIAATGKESYVNYFDRNPMAVGAVSAALGLAVGLALPLTETESELLGETAGSLRDRLEGAAKDTVESIKDSADELLDKVGSIGS
jgi:ElaB/YqjD/DUF883 family membrane-anchored ribosome-binding protein